MKSSNYARFLVLGISWFIGVILSCASPSQMAFAEGTLTFKSFGKAVSLMPLDEAIKSAPAKPMTVLEPHMAKERTYIAIPFNALLDKVYGPKWRNAEEVLFTCSDGYQPSIPASKFLSYNAYLAFKMADDSEFSMINTLQNNEKINLGPYYLIWDNIKSPDLRADGASDLPYQVVGIDLIAFAQKFPRISPPQTANAEAKQGFLHFRKYCMTCHTINGDGGGKAPELNYPVSIVEMMHPEMVRRWIDKPTSMRLNTTMPGLLPDVTNREKKIQQLMAYLKVMSKSKKAPAAASDPKK